MTIQENISLKQYTTFRIGGPAKFFCIVTNEDELIEAIGFSKKNKIPFFILGGGSNILVSDAGFPGIVIKMETKGIQIEEVDKKKVKVRVASGENWDDFVGSMVEKGYSGIENLSLIPGTVGGAPVQNIGAYGSEAKDTIESVYVLDTKKDEYITFTNRDCKFDYRWSIFKEDPRRYVVLTVTFILEKDGKLNLEYKDLRDYFEFHKIKNPTLKQVREAVIEIRTRKLPSIKDYGTAGSFFKNVIVSKTKAKELLAKYPEMIVHEINEKKVKIPLAWILDHVCGFKGVRIGDVGAYKSQALVLVNYGNSTAADITNLAQKMVDAVYRETGIEIFPEVEWVE
jgi:UDP-N-acetylmuramate dehydrogenase